MQVTQPTQIVIQENSRPRFDAKARLAHVKAWKESKLSAAKYSKQHNLVASTFYSWIQAYSKQNSNVGSFIPLEIQNTKAQSLLKQRLEISLNSGVNIVIPHLVDINAIAKLIQEIAKCN